MATTMENKKRKLKVILEVDELASCEFKSGRDTVKWEELTRKEQIMACNTLANFYGLFYRVLKNGESK